VRQGRVLDEWVVDTGEVLARQQRIVLRNCGVIDPASLEEYRARDGYRALEKALTGMRPAEVIDVIAASGLRGRGGAGFPTGTKWRLARAVQDPQRYVVCNADEGDPGAFMDRSVLEGDPHTVLEGMAIAAFAIGANRGYVYVRAEYPEAVRRLRQAIDQATRLGFLGTNILGRIRLPGCSEGGPAPSCARGNCPDRLH
jgi:NADH:ubiquinone oxidoreductase subunit F (NADH-binding)